MLAINMAEGNKSAGDVSTNANGLSPAKVNIALITGITGQVIKAFFHNETIILCILLFKRPSTYRSCHGCG